MSAKPTQPTEAPDFSSASIALENAHLKACSLVQVAGNLVMDAGGLTATAQDQHHALISSIQAALEETRAAHGQMDRLHRQAISANALPQAQVARPAATYERDQVERLRELVLRITNLSVTVGDIGYYLQNYSNGYAEERDSKANQLQELDRVIQEACKAALAIIHRTPATHA